MWWEHWFDGEMADKIDQIIQRGIVRLEKGRLLVNTSQLTSPYWLHVTGATDNRNCILWHEVFFNQFKVIHSFCRYNCWKCVTHPRNVKELIQFHNLMYVVPFVYNFINPLPGKAGLDVRKYTGKAYSAFNYATSLFEGLRMREIMQHMIRTYLPTEEIDGKKLEDTVFVKRSCTEMEALIPGDDAWWDTPQTAHEIDIERRFEDIFDHQVDVTLQPAWLRDKVLHKWLHYANSIGDESAVDFIKSDPFNVHSRKFDFDDLTKGTEQEAEKNEQTNKETN